MNLPPLPEPSEMDGARWGYTNEDMTNHAIDAYNAGLAAAVPDAQEGKRFQAKFNIGDHVWYMKDNAPIEVIISAIKLFYVGTNQDKITYNAKNVRNSISWLDHTRLPQERLFKSKTELLESL